MEQNINYQKAMSLINHALQEMKSEMREVDDMSLKGDKWKMAKHMHAIMDTVEEKVKQYSKSQTQDDFNNICRLLETLQPSFILNYNEICYDSGLEMLNKTLSAMEKELSEVDRKELSDWQEEKANYMHEIYDQLSEMVDQFATSHEHDDFEITLRRMEKLKPEFVLNYNEITQ